MLDVCNCKQLERKLQSLHLLLSKCHSAHLLTQTRSEPQNQSKRRPLESLPLHDLKFFLLQFRVQAPHHTDHDKNRTHHPLPPLHTSRPTIQLYCIVTVYLELVPFWQITEYLFALCHLHLLDPFDNFHLVVLARFYECITPLRFFLIKVFDPFNIYLLEIFLGYSMFSFES